MVERYYGGRHYPTEALFAKEVRPNEWYVRAYVYTSIMYNNNIMYYNNAITV